MDPKKENIMTKAKFTKKGNISMTEGSQYLSLGEMIRLKLEYAWIIQFFILLYSN